MRAALLLCAAGAAAAHGGGPHRNDLDRFVPSALTFAPQAGASVTLSQASAADGDVVVASIVNPAFASHGDFIAQYLAAAAAHRVRVGLDHLEQRVAVGVVDGRAHDRQLPVALAAAREKGGARGRRAVSASERASDGAGKARRTRVPRASLAPRATTSGRARLRAVARARGALARTRCA